MDWSTILDYGIKIVGIALGTLGATLISILFAKLKSEIGESKLIPSERICEKLFACKGAKIFTTELEYEFATKDAKAYNLFVLMQKLHKKAPSIGLVLIRMFE